MALTNDQFDGIVRNYRGKFGRMQVTLNSTYEYTATVSVPENTLAAIPLIFSGSAIRLGGSFKVNQLIVYEDSAPAVTTPNKIPGTLHFFTPSDVGNLTGTIATEFDIGALMTWEDYAGSIDVLDTDYKKIKKGSKYDAVAIVKDTSVDITCYKDSRVVLGVFVTEDGSGSKSVTDDTKLHFIISVLQD